MIRSLCRNKQSFKKRTISLTTRTGLNRISSVCVMCFASLLLLYLWRLFTNAHEHDDRRFSTTHREWANTLNILHVWYVCVRMCVLDLQSHLLFYALFCAHCTFLLFSLRSTWASVFFIYFRSARVQPTIAFDCICASLCWLLGQKSTFFCYYFFFFSIFIVSFSEQ